MRCMMLLLLMQLPVWSSAQSVENLRLQKERLNFFISCRSRHLDPATMSSQFQAVMTGLFHKRKFYCLVVASANEMSSRMEKILKKNNALIGNIWFDSHGHFNRRRSLFEIGKDEFSFHSIGDSIFIIPLSGIAQYCDTNTNVGIGSCYGGASFTLPAIEEFPAQRMNGDSLMMELSKILNGATVVGSESFVMTKPGMFKAGYALAGRPTRKKFKDEIYKPVWENLGSWNCYDGRKDSLYRVNTVSLSRCGEIRSKKYHFLAINKNRKKQLKKLLALERGHYNLAALYQY
jgi:hypothetical protein